MKPLAFASAACLLLCGCAAPKTADTPPTAGATTGNSVATQTPPNGAANTANSGTIAPMGPNVGGMTPVSGTENIDGGTGGGLAQSAKDRAKKVAGQGSTSTDTTTDSD